PIRVVDVVKTKAALDAQPAFVGRAVPALHADDFFTAHLPGDQAADAAEGADRIDAAVHGLRTYQGLGAERTGRAGLHALAATYAGAQPHGIVQVEHRPG